jgi:hypothetical protein
MNHHCDCLSFAKSLLVWKMHVGYVAAWMACLNCEGGRYSLNIPPEVQCTDEMPKKKIPPISLVLAQVTNAIVRVSGELVYLAWLTLAQLQEVCPPGNDNEMVVSLTICFMLGAVQAFVKLASRIITFANSTRI